MLEAFEGPLDLLLYLIRKENLDILDIPMAPLTRQYLEYVEIMRTTNLELAAEYLVMAAMLMEIKSRMLLPRPPAAEAIEEDPRAELVRRLLEYEQMKKAAQELDELPQVGRDVIAISVWIEKTGLAAPARRACAGPRGSLARAAAPRAAFRAPPRLPRGALGARAHERDPARACRSAGARVRRAVRPAARRAVLVVTFLALLELARELLVEITQSDGFAPIYVKLAHAQSA